MLTQLKSNKDKAKFYFQNGAEKVGRVLNFDEEEIKLVAERKKINISELARIEIIDEREQLKTDNRLEMTRKARSIEGFER